MTRKMEVRERKSPRVLIPSTVDSQMVSPLQDYDGDQEARDYGTEPEKVKSPYVTDKWNYPMKPAFYNTDDDSDDDDDSIESDDMVAMTTCCCCFNTKNGSLAVGLVSLIIAFCISVASCFALINHTDLIAALTNVYEEYQQNVRVNITDSRFDLIDKVIGTGFIAANIRAILIVVLSFYAIYTFACLFLTYGACTNLRSLLLPWIALEFIPFGIQLAIIVITFVYGKDDAFLSQSGGYIIAGLIFITSFVIHVYWWMCVVAHYQSLKGGTEVEPLANSESEYLTVPKY